MEWVIATLIALIAAIAGAVQAWGSYVQARVSLKQHSKQQEAEGLKPYTPPTKTSTTTAFNPNPLQPIIPASSTPSPFPTTYPHGGVNLVSEVGADYTNLRDLLVARKYKEADQETARIMLWVACREKEGWLDEESINKFPCSDLRTIDQLWVQNSNGRFGFSVQKEIYNQVGKDFVKFADQVEWKVGENWKSYDQLMFEMRSPRGHIPALGVFSVSGFDDWINWWGFRGFGEALLSRRDL